MHCQHDALASYAEKLCKRSKNYWNLAEQIGQGNSATVYRVSGPAGDAALKIYSPRFFEGENALVEVRRIERQMELKGHENEYLVDFIDAGEIDDTHFLLMEYFPWKSIDRRLTKIDRSKIGSIVAKVACAAKYLESLNLVHRDIKPANIIVSDDCLQVKLLDLGVLRPISTDESYQGTDFGNRLPFIATAQYSSPAYLIRNTPPTKQMWKALTYYQIGAVLHDLILQRPLFHDSVCSGNRYVVAASVLREDPYVFAEDIPPSLITLARDCLVKEDNERLNRVSWQRFAIRKQASLDEMRKRLSLGGKPNAENSSSFSHSSNKEEQDVNLGKAEDLMIDLARHVLRKENFPVGTLSRNLVEGDRNRLRIVANSLVPNFSTNTDLKLHLVLFVRCSEDPQKLDIEFAAAMTKFDHSLSCKLATDVLWSTKFCDLEQESAQIIDLLTHNFINAYAVAADHVVSFEESSDILAPIAVRP